MFITIGLILVGAVLIAVLIRVATSRPEWTPTLGEATAEKAAWLKRARTAGAEGQRVTLMFNDYDEILTFADLNDENIDEITIRLDLLTSHLSLVTSTAPTSMDVRVCRSVAISARALSDQFRGERAARQSAPISPPTTNSYSQQKVDFEYAVRDLMNHVELL